ncbi:FAD/NAD(P)-binding domain-containing protein [Aaosphaeria arxii CBS 175.79]|uniref:FAD/NAD(P)-binding domain-containing protein n=1 Tax=Aaosphaeria arxii CBS 175.79 TaxID=1450172 RepID=A0A6A5XNJ4_9PLEO|nr:FAD/NAD(P)-binding domain-containing protein [Aaosphaeria arxii CBS 175.79]KAF2014417.1 FAD/NAD(P)-binding domain-containing protein [Aaosphaeria arxii CBS 175.79]
MFPLESRLSSLIWFSLSAFLLSLLLINSPEGRLPLILVDHPDNITDVLILGGSHAGLSGALTLARHQHDIIVFDDSKPRNWWNTPMHVLPTWEHRSPSDLRRTSRRELQSTGLVTFVEEKIVKVEKEHDSLFHATGSSGKKWSGKKLLVAIGNEFDYPDIPGYKDNFPDKILHCLFTRGFEFRGSASAGVIAADLASSPPHAAILVEDASKFAENVTLYTNGDHELAKAISTILVQKGESHISIDPRKIIRLAKNTTSNGITLSFSDGNDRTESFLVHQPATKMAEGIVGELGLETNARGDIVTKMPFYQTNVPGVFAAGDSANPFKNIPSAIFQGANAGAGIARELPRRFTRHSTNRLQSGGLTTWFTNWIRA